MWAGRRGLPGGASGGKRDHSIPLGGRELLNGMADSLVLLRLAMGVAARGPAEVAWELCALAIWMRSLGVAGRKVSETGDCLLSLP